MVVDVAHRDYSPGAIPAQPHKLLTVGQNKNAVSALYEYGMSIGQEVNLMEIDRSGEDHCPT